MCVRVCASCLVGTVLCPVVVVAIYCSTLACHGLKSVAAKLTFKKGRSRPTGLSSAPQSCSRQCTALECNAMQCDAMGVRVARVTLLCRPRLSPKVGNNTIDATLRSSSPFLVPSILCWFVWANFCLRPPAACCVKQITAALPGNVGPFCLPSRLHGSCRLPGDLVFLRV